MAQTIKINGIIYNDVKEMKAPLASDTTKEAVFVDSSDANAEADDIKNGKTAYINGKKVTGSHTDPTFSLTNGVLSIA